MGGNRSKSAFLKGVGHFERRFQKEGGITHQPVLVSETRVIAVSCGIKISAAHHLVCHNTRICQTDGQTDRQTKFRQQYRALHYMQSHGKMSINSKLVSQ